MYPICRMLPNAEHGMAPHYLKIYESAVSFWLSYLEVSIQTYTVCKILHRVYVRSIVVDVCTRFTLYFR